MGKSKSSSARKKRSKYSSLDKKSKTKRAKSKKLRRHDDSDSDSDSYSTDDSRSSASVSVSPKDSYRGRKSRSKKRIKRRARSRSCSSSSKGSFRSRKKKVSRKKVDSKVRKKTILKHKKKKKSSSSDSSDESEYESRRGRSQKRRDDSKISKNGKGRSKKRRYRSRSCSSSSRDSGDGGDYRIEHKETDGNIPKRLKSVITVAKDENEERELDEYKEEIVYEDDGYPSSKSNDSNDSGNIRSTENDKLEDHFDMKSTEPLSDGFVTKDSQGEKADETVEASGNENEDLETILRQKALENLRKFRGGKQMKSNSSTTGKDENRGALESPCLKETDLSQNDPKDDSIRGITGDSVQEEKILDGENGSKESGRVENKLVKREKVNMSLGSGISKPRLVTSALKQALSNCMSSKVEVPKVKLGNENELSVDGKTECVKLNKASSSTGRNDGSQDEDIPKLPESQSSETVRSGQEMNSSEGQEGSQLERKTMSVMRGGELVQVSYKVYIPKKAPALTRRQLKR